MPVISPVHVAFGDALRQIRQEQGMSQEALALKSGLNRGYYSGVERGHRNVSLTNITKLARALGVPASHLLATAETLQPNSLT